MASSRARETLGAILRTAKDEAGTWDDLEKKLGVPKNLLWRHSDPERLETNGKNHYSTSLMNGAALEKTLDGLGFELAIVRKGEAPTGTMVEVGAAIWALPEPRFVKAVILATTWAIYNEHRAWTKAPNAEDGE